MSKIRSEHSISRKKRGVQEGREASSQAGSRLEVFCNTFLEACWLAAVIAVPVIFNTGSARVFEPEKLAVLRSFVFFMLAGWLVKLAAQARRQGPGSIRSMLPVEFKHPIPAAVLALGVVSIASTAASIAPLASFWGSYDRQQGLLTQLSFVCFFLILIVHLDTREKIGRLITAAIVSALFVSLYGILQHFHLDPVLWTADVSNRVTTTTGNPVTAAACVAMILPLTILRAAQSGWTVFRNRDIRAGALIHFCIYLITGSAQIALILFSQSRGPFLGLLVSVGILALGAALYHRRRAFTFALLSMGAAAAAVLAWVNLAPPAPFRMLTFLNGSDSNGQIRSLYWQDTARLVLPHAPIPFSDGQIDALNSLRPLIGYGPDSLVLTYPHVYSPTLTQLQKQYAPTDRAHNQVWDQLATTGLAGLIAYQSLIVLIFFYFLKWSSLISARRDLALYWTCVLGGGILLSAGLSAWRGVSYLGIGLPAGLLCGFCVYAASALFQKGQDEKVPSERFFILATALAAIAGHGVETLFGFDVSATQTAFWMCAAIFTAAGLRPAVFERVKGEAPFFAGRSSGYPAAQTQANWLDFFLPGAALLLAGLCAYTANLQPIRADMSFHQGDGFSVQKNWQAAAALYNRSRQLAPQEDHYTLAAADALVQQAGEMSGDRQKFDALMAAAEQDLILAWKKTPADSLPVISLADVYAVWAQQSPEGAEQQRYGEQANRFYSTAITMRPTHAELYYKQALLNLQVFNQTEIAQQQLKQALELDPYYDTAYGLDGSVAIRQALATQAGSARDALLDRAVSDYQKAVSIAGDRADYLIPLGTLYNERQQYGQAADCYRRALPVAAADSRWRIYYSLAQVVLKTADPAGAVEYAQQALKTAPSENQAEISGFISQVSKTP